MSIKSKQEQALEFAKQRNEWRSDPIKFFNEVLGMTVPPHQKKLLQECTKRNRIAIKSANSLGKCSLYSDFVVLGNGTLVKAKDLIDKEFNILTYDEKEDKQYSGTARAVDNGVKECYEITTKTGKVISRTSNHPLYKAHTQKTNRRIDGRRLTIEPIVDGWTECKDLKAGDYILVPITHEIVPSKFDFTDEECKLLGYLLGDGGTTDSVKFTQEDNKQLKEFKECVEGFGCTLRNLSKPMHYMVVSDGKIGHNKVLNKVKEWGIYGCKSTEKLIPEFVGTLPLTQIALILNRFYACDGYTTTRLAKRFCDKNCNCNDDFWDCRIGITLANKDLIKQIRLLLMRFGIESWMRHKPSKCNGKIFDAWELVIYKRDSIIKFCENIGIYGKEEALNKCLEHAKAKSVSREKKYFYLNCPDGFMWEQVKEVKNIGEHPTVCIEVDNTHTYLTEVYDHNSHCVAALAFHFFFTRVTDDPNDTCMVIITAPTFSQIKQSIFANIKTFAEEAERYVKKRFGEEYSFLPKKFSESANVCEYYFNPKCFIAGVATGEGNEGAGNTLSGRHATHVMIIADESQAVTEGTFSSFEGILSGGEETKYILLGNTTLPNGASGTYYDAFQENSTFNTLSLTAFDSPNFTEPSITLEDMLAPEVEPNNWRKKLDAYCGTNYKEAVRRDEVDQWENDVKKKLPLSAITNPINVYRILERCGFNPEQYEVLTRVLAEFPMSGGKCVIDAKQLDTSFNNYDNPDCYEDGVTAMGVDISAGLGRDFSTICVRRGNKVISLEEYQLNAPEFEEKIKEVYSYYGCNYCNLERDGMGEIVYQHLIENDDMVINPIQSGGAPGILEPMSSEEDEINEQAKKEYHRQRDYLWFNLSHLLSPYYCNKHGGKPILLPRNNKLKKQLLSATWEKTSANKTQVTSKKDIRKKLGSSTDLADAVIFAFANPGESYSNNYLDCDFMSFNNTSWH